MESLFNKIENKVDLKKLVKKIFIVFMIMQPVLDIYMCLFDSKIQILGVSLATIIRFAVVFLMTILIMIHARKNKSTKFLLGYAILVGVYAIFHHLNAVRFTVELPHASYSVFGELLYLARMCIPIAMIYIVYWIKPNYKDIKKIVIGVSLIISLTILITNILKVSYKSYSLEDQVIADNIFSWFTSLDKYYWVDLTSRGFFAAGNQVSGVMIILAPIVAYIALKEKKIRNWLVVLFHVVAMLCLTTRIGVIGGIGAIIGISAIYILQKIIHKDFVFKELHYKSAISFIVVLIAFGVLYQNSPFRKRVEDGNFSYDIMINVPEESQNVVQPPEKIELNDAEKLEYLAEALPGANISEYYSYYAYPYYNDIGFWYDFVNMPEYERAGNRKIRKILINRILERDGKISNYILGISFTRASSFIWPERDIETQIDSLGIVGEILFISPYIIILIYGIWKFFRKFKDNLYLRKVVYLSSLGVGILAGYVSGHVMNEMFPFLFLSMMAGIVLNMALGNEPEEYEKEPEKNKRKLFKVSN